jgi:hypothetical protein
MSLVFPRRGTDRLSYPASTGRDLRIDLLRGAAVILMIIDHLAGPSVLRLVTYGGGFFTSAAEAFVFISGFVAATVYGRLAITHGLRRACGRMLQRAGLLYLLASALTLLVLPISERLGSGPCNECAAEGLSLDNPLQLVWSVLSLHQTYYLVDIPLLYARLLVLAPLALLLLTRGKTWLLLAVSVGIWALFQIAPDRVIIGWRVAGNSMFHLPAWQLLFVVGMVLGYHRPWLARRMRPASYKWWLMAAVIGCVVLVVAHRVVSHADGLGATTSALVAWLFSKPAVGPGRLVASAVVFTAAFLGVHLAWMPVRRALGGLLLPLGQHALYAYTAHTLCGLAIVAAGAALGHPITDSGVENTALQVGATGLIWLAIRYHVLMPGRLIHVGSISEVPGTITRHIERRAQRRPAA